MFYIEENNKITFVFNNEEEFKNQKEFHPDWQNLELKKVEDGYTIYDFKLMTTEQAQKAQKQKEREKINQLSLTKREVFLALYKDKGITPEQIRATIVDPASLIEFDYANDYFRGNPLIEQIGVSLGYTSEELDYLFENGSLKEKEV